MTDWQSFSLYSDPMMRYLDHEIQKVASQHEAPFQPSEFQHFDALHYCGYEYLNPFMQTLPANPRVLDIGAGIGGPARHVAQTFGAEVVAIDPLERYTQLQQRIDQLCGLEEQITVVQADAATDDLARLPRAAEGFDAIYAILSFLHIADKDALLANCRKVLKPGGRLYIEDWAIQDTTPFTPEEAEAEQRVGMTSRLTQAEYQAHLHQAGFAVSDFQFRSQQWSRFVWDRGNALASREAELKAEYGEDWWQAWSSWGAQYALYAFHDLNMPLDAVKATYPHAVAQLGEAQTERFTQGGVRQKFGGAYIQAKG